MNRELPEGWKVIEIKNIIKESRVEVDNDDSSKRLSVKLNLGGVIKRTERDTDLVGATKYFKRFSGQFIYGKQNLHKGAFGIIPAYLDGFSSSQDLPSFDVENGFSSNWLYQFFSQENYYKSLERIATGTGSKRIQPKELLNEKVPLPPLPEQEKIAKILSSVDDVIEKTSLQIKKLNDLKKSTMNELLTKGIGHTEFKPSELGQIPTSWEVVKLINVCSLIRDGTHLPPPRTSEGIPLLSVRNMIGGGFKLLPDDTFVSLDFYEKMHSKWKPNSGDILLAVVGATIGKVCQVPTNFPVFTLQRSVAILRGENNILSNNYLHTYFQSELFKKCLWDRVNQTAQPGLYLAELGQITIPYPTYEEQNEISNIIISISNQIEKATNKLKSLNALKKSLMQDLLSGKVRVKV